MSPLRRGSCYTACGHTPFSFRPISPLRLSSFIVLQAAFSSGSFKRLRSRVSASVDEEHECEGEEIAGSAQTCLVLTVEVDRPYSFSSSSASCSSTYRCSASAGDEEIQQHSVVDFGRRKKLRQGGSDFSEREWLYLALCLNYVRVPSCRNTQRVMYACAGRCLLTITVIIVVLRLPFGVGHPHSPEISRLGHVIPSFLALVHHLLGVCVPRYLASAYFHARACRWLGRHPGLLWIKIGLLAFASIVLD